MSELPGQTEVLVVGAGPVGLAVAASLVGHGHDVTVVERQAVGANTSRAAVVHARTLEMLEGIGVSERLAELGIHASQFSIRDGDRELVPVRFDQLPTECPYTLMVPQNITEQVLLDRLEELGARVHRPYVATGLSQTADGAEVTVESGDMIKALLGPDVEFVRTDYDVDAAAEAVLASGQPRAVEVAETLVRPPSSENASAEFEQMRAR